MLSCCTNNPYKNKQCKRCWKESRYHCTWHNCLRPVFALTLCRNHYRCINVKCAWETCQRPSYCKQVCAHHYRKKSFPPVRTCTTCSRPEYMDQRCFYHFTYRTCIKCHRTVFSKQLCRRHYMRQWRAQRSLVTGPTTNSDSRPATIQDTPVTINHIPEIQSSFTQSDISV